MLDVVRLCMTSPGARERLAWVASSCRSALTSPGLVRPRHHDDAPSWFALLHATTHVGWKSCSGCFPVGLFYLRSGPSTPLCLQVDTLLTSHDICGIVGQPDSSVEQSVGGRRGAWERWSGPEGVSDLHVLLVESHRRPAGKVAGILEKYGYRVTRASGIEHGLSQVDQSIDIIVLNAIDRHQDAWEFCRRVRSIGDTPLLITSQPVTVETRVHGLNIGADDYLAEPYDARELMARMSAVFRRTARATTSGGRRPVGAVRVIEHRGVVIDFERHLASVDESPVSLTPKEFKIVNLLAQWPELVIRREQILSSVWNSLHAHDQRTLTVHVSRIRQKTQTPSLIETVSGIGYRLALSTSLR